MTTLKTTNLTYNDFRKSKANPEPPDKDQGLDWDSIRSAYEARLDWEEAQGLDPVERQGRIPETEKPAPVKQSVKPRKKAAPKPKGERKKPGPKPKPKKKAEPKLPGPKPRVGHDRILELHKQGMINAQIARELGYSPQWISQVLARHGIRVETSSEKCRSGLHSMEEFGVQEYRVNKDGETIKDGRHCKECRRLAAIARRKG